MQHTLIIMLRIWNIKKIPLVTLQMPKHKLKFALKLYTKPDHQQLLRICWLWSVSLMTQILKYTHFRTERKYFLFYYNLKNTDTPRHVLIYEIKRNCVEIKEKLAKAPR